MRRALLPLMLLVASCQPAAGPLSDQDVAALKGLGQSYAQAVLAADADAVVALYTEDAIEMAPNVPARTGKDAIRAAYQEGMQFTTQITMAAVQVEGRADLAYDRGTWTWSGTIPGFGPSSDSGKYLAIARRQADGSWLWTTVIWNSDAPPPQVQ